MIRQLSADDLKSIERRCRPAEIPGDVTLGKDFVLSLLNEVLYHRGRHHAGTLEIRSLVSMKDQKPYVTLEFGNTTIQLSVKDTLDHAKRLIEVACGAAADGYLAHFFKTELDITDPAKFGPFIQAFRTYRDEQLGLLAPDQLPPPETKDL